MSGLLRFILDDDLSCSCLLRSCGSGLGVAGRESPGGELLFFASPKKSNQKKGDPQSRPLCGSLKKLKEPENLETSRLRRRRTSKFFNPAPLTFSSPARTGWGISPDSGKAESDSIPSPVLAGLRSAGGNGSKFLDVRRLRSRLVSKNSADFEHRKLPVAKRRDPDCGSPFLWLLSFGEAKESDSQPGDSRQLRVGELLFIKKLFAPVFIGLEH